MMLDACVYRMFYNVRLLHGLRVVNVRCIFSLYRTQYDGKNPLHYDW